MTFKINNIVLRDYIQSLGVEVPMGQFRLVGIRGALPHETDQISLQRNVIDHWNDTVGIWGGEWALYRATVEPGLFYTQNPMNPKGAAHLLGLENGGRPWRFRWGRHKGYEALVQGEAFSVGRDRNRDGKIDPGEPIETGHFGIHVHWGGRGWSVGKWSAGCQVLFGGGDRDSPWTDFKARLRASGQDRFDYFLIDGRELARFLKLI
jgi:hypothetical protein